MFARKYIARQIKNAEKNNHDLKFEAMAFSVIFALPKKKETIRG